MAWTPQKKGEAFELVLESRAASLRGVRCVSNTKLYSPHLDKITEIDVLVLSPWKVYCLEAKSYSTALYGNIEEERWVGLTRDKVTTPFNPIIQNFEHVRALKYNLSRNNIFLPDIASVVVVPNTCDISKAAMKDHIVKQIDTFIGDLVSDSLIFPHRIDVDYMLNNIIQIRDLYGGARIG